MSLKFVIALIAVVGLVGLSSAGPILENPLDGVSLAKITIDDCEGVKIYLISDVDKREKCAKLLGIKVPNVQEDSRSKRSVDCTVALEMLSPGEKKKCEGLIDSNAPIGQVARRKRSVDCSVSVKLMSDAEKKDCGIKVNADVNTDGIL